MNLQEGESNIKLLSLERNSTVDSYSVFFLENKHGGKEVNGELLLLLEELKVRLW